MQIKCHHGNRDAYRCLQGLDFFRYLIKIKIKGLIMFFNKKWLFFLYLFLFNQFMQEDEFSSCERSWYSSFIRY